MPKTVVQEDRDFSPAAENEATVTQLPLVAIQDPVRALRPAGSLGSRGDIEAELDLIAAAIRAFYGKQPDQVMRECAGFSARLTELAVLLHREEGYDRQYARIRTQQVERFLAELDRQFKVASRLVEVQRQDLELLRG